MEHFNQTLFLLLNASAHPSAMLVGLATVLANDVIWLVPITLMIGWLRGGEVRRKLLLQAACTGLSGLLINQAIGMVWTHPRPFMMGIGHTLIAHAADSSFPSDHLTLLWSVAFSCLLHARLRFAGWILAGLGVPVAWARIYLGVHFPFDMLGALLVAALSARICLAAERAVFEPMFLPVYLLYRQLFAPLIRRGWVRL